VLCFNDGENAVYEKWVTTEGLYKLFYRGKYQDVVSYLLDRDPAPVPPSFTPPLVASLTFLGRIDEAEMLYERAERELGALEKTICRFFLGVVKCRHFQFARARRYFGVNAREARRASGLNTIDADRIRFYVCQGFGFYRYTYGHLLPALRWAKKAYQASFRADYLFGRLFSQDLLAHVEINLGRTHVGLKLIEQNIRLATSMDRDAVVQMSRVTRVIYRSRFGISSTDASEELLRTLSETTFEDGYSRACLLAELAHQYVLRGNATQAKETLNTACEYVYRIDNPRLEILLNFRIAYLLAQKGELAQSLHLVRSSLERLREKVDRHLEMKLRGLEFQLLTRLGETATLPALAGELKTLTRKTGYFVASRLLERREGRYSSSQFRLQDPLGDFIDDIDRGGSEVISEILEKGWFGLLYKVCDVDPTVRTLLIGLSGKSLTLFEAGNVRHVPRGASNQVAKFLCVLADGPKGKEEIITRVWGERYHPLRHDPLLYTLVSKLRKELGEHCAWVEASEKGYELQRGVIVREFQRAPEPASEIVHATEMTDHPELSFRQRQILGLAQQTSFIDVKILGEQFSVSPATANRDLSQLEKLGWLSRSGRGRATRYHYQTGGTLEKN